MAYILAIAVALGSFGLYMSAFFFPEVYRKYDLTWSGVGLFYALVLWVCARQITGGVLLGQMASVALLGWFSWQNLQQRRYLTPKSQRTPLPGSAQTLAAAIRTKAQEWSSDLPQKLRTMPLPGGLNRTLAQATDAAIAGTSNLQQAVQNRPASQTPRPNPVIGFVSGVASTLGNRLQRVTRQNSRPSSAPSPRDRVQVRLQDQTPQAVVEDLDDFDELIDAEFEPIGPESTPVGSEPVVSDFSPSLDGAVRSGDNPAPSEPMDAIDEHSERPLRSHDPQQAEAGNPQNGLSPDLQVQSDPPEASAASSRIDEPAIQEVSDENQPS